MFLAVALTADTVQEQVHEILGRPPVREDLLGYAERLHRTPSMVPIIVEELVALARSQQ